jgi:hypothetical protein
MGQTNDFISANLNMTNNAILYSDAESTPTGASLGPLQVTGSVTVAGMTDSTAGVDNTATHEDMLAELEASTVTARLMEFNWAEDSATQPIALYVAILGVTGPTDIGGMQAWTYNFELAGDGTNTPLKIHGGASGETWLDALFYAGY